MAAPLPQKPGMAGMPPQQQQQSHMPPTGALVAGQQPMAPQGALREISPVFLCRIGQETVQDIVTRTMEIFQITRATQLPNGVTQSQAMYQDRFGKLQEHLRQLALLFRKLRLLYERCVEMTADLQEGPGESVHITTYKMPSWRHNLSRATAHARHSCCMLACALCWRRAGQRQSGAL
ncbi:mediator of RNA polymerase II transcription subunit 30-like isoform X2 [Nerophis ophidion]|uniref:mediator of RNA polymerase II transcription subunit 30-like isoform X2 n=1 Tax=Nerophis ophidion TaxID=159077 RepID=UPI002ADFF731|nr:mediator of RNA polymerase II transcription subunit 30-like isoform X2 [Nerophis ophidion]